MRLMAPRDGLWIKVGVRARCHCLRKQIEDSVSTQRQDRREMRAHRRRETRAMYSDRHDVVSILLPRVEGVTS